MSTFNRLLLKLLASSTLFYLVLFITSPIAVQLSYAIVCDNVESDSSACDSSEVSSVTSRTLLLVGLSQTIPSFLMSGFYASLADRYGRKWALYIPNIGYTVYVACLLYLSIKRTYVHQVSLMELTYMSAIGLGSLGMSGSFSTYQMALFTYTADITKKQVSRRGTVYSLLEASLFFSKTVGPIAAGLFAQSKGFNGPLLLSAGMCIMTLLWNTCILPESIDDHFPNNEVQLVFDPLRTFRNVGTLFRKWRSVMPWTSIAFFLFFIAYMGNNEIIILFVKHQFGWDPATIGYYEATDAMIQAIGMILLPVAVEYYWGSYIDTHWLLIGYIARTVHYLLFAYSTSTAMIFAICPIVALASTITPRSKAIVSNSVRLSEQATVMSGVSAIQSAALFSLPAVSLGYSYTVFYLPQLMYFVFSGLCAVSAALIVYLLCGLGLNGVRKPKSKGWEDSLKRGQGRGAANGEDGWDEGQEEEEEEEEGEGFNEPLLTKSRVHNNSNNSNNSVSISKDGEGYAGRFPRSASADKDRRQRESASPLAHKVHQGEEGII